MPAHGVCRLLNWVLCMSVAIAKPNPFTDKPPPAPDEPLLEVRNLKVYFPFRRGSILRPEQGFIRAVDGVSFAIGPGETLGIVGESGCGKSVAALSVLRLLPARLGRTVAGSVHFDGVDLLARSEAEMRDIRGNRIAMIFQEPMTSLN